MSEVKKILFVDDDESIISGIKLTVGRKFEVSTSTSVTEALEIFKSEGPFAVVVSDFQMPVMNGADFLQKIRETDLEVVTMLLTGAANFEEISDAVHHGRIFRLLGKPCSKEKMVGHLDAALAQYRMIRAEKDLLEETLNGALRALSAILAASKPLFFGRAQRVKNMSFDLAKQLKINDPWRLELASTFTYLGHVGLPDSVQKDVYDQNDLSQEVQEIISRFPEFISSVLGEIPRLDEIPTIIRHIDDDYNSQVLDKTGILKLASILRFSQEYDVLAASGRSNKKIFEVLSDRQRKFLPGVLDAFLELYDFSEEADTIDVVHPSEFLPGMEINQDLYLPDETLIAPKGTIVEQHFMRIIDNYYATYHGGNPFPEKVQVILRKKK